MSPRIQRLFAKGRIAFGVRWLDSALDGAPVTPSKALSSHRTPKRLMEQTLMAEREHRVARGRIRHELANVRGGVSLLVDRDAPPRAGRHLVRHKPSESLGNFRVVFPETGCLKDVKDQPGRVTVGSGLLSSPVTADITTQRGQAPTAILALLLQQLLDDLLLFLVGQHSIQFRGRP